MSEISENIKIESSDVIAVEGSENTQSMLPGAQLAAQRMALGWTVQQISDQLKLAPRQILAMEQDNYDALPGLAVTRGFVRAYAKLLKLDVMPLMALMTQDVVVPTVAVPLRRAVPTTFSSARLPFLGGRRAIMTRWNLGVVLLGFLLLIALLAQQMNWIPAVSDTFDIKTEKEAALLNAPPLQSAASAPDNQTIVAADVPVAQIAAMPIAAEIPATADVDPAGKNQLVVKIHQDSWIEIRQKNGSSVLSRLLKAGAIESFDVGSGLTLTVGNAGGVEVLLRGQPLEIKSSAKNNIARIKLN